MRSISFIVAFAVVLIGPSLANTADGGLPGVGTFSYHGAPVVTDPPTSMVVTAR